MRTLEFCRHLLRKLESPTLLNFQRQADARYLYYNVKETNLPRFNTNLNESLSLSAYMYISLGLDFYHYQQIEDSEHCFDRAGSILEHLHRNKDHQNDISRYTLLISSLSYYCGGQISKAFVIAKEVYIKDDTPPIGKMICLFLTRKYILLRDVLDSMFIDSDDKLPFELSYGRCLANVLYFFEHGDFNRLDSAIDGIAKIAQEAMDNLDPGLWWVCRLSEFLLGKIRDTSLWKHIPKLGTDSRLIQRYINNLYYTKGITELFKTQISALDVICNDNGAVISLPTSSGKTRIAELAILRTLMADPESAVLYLAPFRSLAYEVETDFESVFPPLEYNVSHLYGNNDFSESDRKAMDESSIWIATPEKAKAIFRCGGFHKRISLVVMDEGHLISANERDLANEMFVEELRYKISAYGGQFLVLSAVLPNVKDITAWLTNSEDNQFTSNWQISSQRTGVIVGHKHVADIEWNQEHTLFNNNFISNIRDRKSTCAAAAIRLQQAFDSVLVYVPQARHGLSYAKAIYDMLDNDVVNWQDGTCDWDKFVLKCREEDPSGLLLNYAQKGIICHNANLPTNLRLSIERLLRKGKAKFVVSSSTLAQGVNIGISSVIFSSLNFGTGTIKKRDFWNIAGRAGRAFVDTEGRVLTYVDATDAQKFRFNLSQAWDYMDNKQLDIVVSGLLSTLRDMLDLFETYGLSIEQMEGVLENDGFDIIKLEDQPVFNKLECIDDSLLSLILEQNNSIEEVSKYAESMLVLRQAEVTYKYRLKRLLLARVRRNMRYATQGQSHLAYTGMPLAASSYLFENFASVQIALQTYAESEQGIDDILLLADQIEDIVNALPSNRIKKADKSLLNKYRRYWFGGEFIAEKEAREVVETFYSLSATWVLNSIAGYYSNVEQNEEMSAMIGKINGCMRLGLPTYSACRVFMAGIESRLAAVELATYVEGYADDMISVIQRILLGIRDMSRLSNRAIDWLDVLHRENRAFNERTTYVPQCRLHTNEDYTDSILYVCKRGELFYVRNADYTLIRQINPKNYDMDKAANKPGVYYFKTDQQHYELVSDNCRLWIIND